MPTCIVWPDRICSQKKRCHFLPRLGIRCENIVYLPASLINILIEFVEGDHDWAYFILRNTVAFEHERQ